MTKITVRDKNKVYVYEYPKEYFRNKMRKIRERQLLEKLKKSRSDIGFLEELSV